MTWIRGRYSLAAAGAHPLDSAATAALTAVSLAGLWLVSWSSTDHYRSPDVVGVLLTLVIVVPLAWRQRHPGAVLVISATALLGYDALRYRSGLAWLATYWAVYSYAAHRRGRDGYLPLAVWIAAILAHLALPGQVGNTVETALIYLVITAFVWVRGDTVRAGRLEARRQRDALAHQAVAAERTRMARELHDVISQALGVVVAQAGGAASMPALAERDARAVLRTIEEAGRQALVEMRGLVGALRDGDGEAGLTSQPTVAEIPALVARLAAAGLSIDLTVDGEARPVSAGVGLSAYRIVQEALTNTLKHSDAAHALVRLVWSAECLEIEVTDHGGQPVATGHTDAEPGSGGRGLTGMRERVALFGGDLEAGPQPGGGYRVAAHLPVGGLS